MARLDFTKSGRSDLKLIIDDLSLVAAPDVAPNYSADFDTAFMRLTQFPRIGAPRPAFGREVRIWTVEPYAIFYRYADAPDTVVILRILHGKRNVTRKLLAGGT